MHHVQTQIVIDLKTYRSFVTCMFGLERNEISSIKSASLCTITTVSKGCCYLIAFMYFRTPKMHFVTPGRYICNVYIYIYLGPSTS